MAKNLTGRNRPVS